MESNGQLMASALFYIDRQGISSRFSDFDYEVCTLKRDKEWVIDEWKCTYTDEPTMKELLEFDSKEVEEFYHDNYILPGIILMANARLSFTQDQLNKIPLSSMLENALIFNTTLHEYQVCRQKGWESLTD